ncbi:hypothetical protein DFR58_1056 [Anaerobacterium chartisolvens]|uniref:Calcineurin-like phosphoesterase domain-containing protein n=1 Tax=Anaerobacterium chartisolvens TaxID=1297424 RepID=A0A369BCB9_9FIRM|nr:metallophosphoesterase [Anaerobacterium chartisolvens]RCX18248.1 hypothetical protein DFR58_1056 [Anaerobacterium chartisolvens]
MIKLKRKTALLLLLSVSISSVLLSSTGVAFAGNAFSKESAFNIGRFTGRGGIKNGNPKDTPRSNYDFTYAWESDTQYYNSNDLWNKHQINIHNWLVSNRDRMNIRYLFHTGDIVDDSREARQWENADPAYRILDEAGLPYGVLAGNHDVAHGAFDYTGYCKYFGERRYRHNPWYGGSYKNNKGHYDLISAGGIDFIMVYMGWGIGDSEIDWINSVLERYPRHRAMLCLHEYLTLPSIGGFREESRRVYNEVVKPNSNVFMVLSGHYYCANRRADQIDDNGDGVPDRTVHQLLFDYQDAEEGGQGYIRLMHFDLKGERIIVRAYSPSLNDYCLDCKDIPSEEEEFDLPFPSRPIRHSLPPSSVLQ